MTRQQRKDLRQATEIAARAVGLCYGPSECRREDADEHLPVMQQQNSTLCETVVPVRWVYTRNRSIFETQPA